MGNAKREREREREVRKDRNMGRPGNGPAWPVLAKLGPARRHYTRIARRPKDELGAGLKNVAREVDVLGDL